MAEETTEESQSGTFILESKELWAALFTLINLLGPSLGIMFTSQEWAAVGVAAIALIRVFKTSSPIIWKKIGGGSS
jgi:hypothetical protein